MYLYCLYTVHLQTLFVLKSEFRDQKKVSSTEDEWPLRATVQNAVN